MTTAVKTCPQCGAELATDAPLGLCPKCLLAQGLKDGDPAADPNATLEGRVPIAHPVPPKPPTPLAQLPLPSITGYSILREISRGGQAVVYEALQQSTTKKVAIKVMQGGAFVGPKEIARFEREVQILAALNHPNIVQVMDRGTTADGSYFLVMPYLSGQSLDKWLPAYYQKHPDGPPPEDPSELLRLFLKICDAVNAAHLRGVVHRDLKPSNIRMDDNNEPHILDFGLARTAVAGMTDEETPQPVTITGQFLGSLPWASPEQAEGAISKIDTRTDVYSLGVILYQMLTGKFPYEVVGNMADVLKNIQNAKPTPPSTVLAAKEAKQVQQRRRWLRKHRRAINGVIDAIILKALAKRREDRYQSAGELARDLADYLSGRPTVAAGEPPESRWNVRPVTVGIAVACVCLIVSIVWVMNRPARPVHRGIVVQPTEPPRTETVTPAPIPPQVMPSAANNALVVDLGNGVKMKFVLIPSGSFRMGSESGQPKEKIGKNDESPVHNVTLTKAFYLGEYEVTQEQWEAVMGNNPSEFKGSNSPVTNVSWNDCQAFLAKLNEKVPNRRFSLPSEAQWEYASRAGTKEEYCYGDDRRNLPKYSWSVETSGGTTHPVGELRANAWSLHDMFGNVMEWCADYHDEAYYGYSPTLDPPGPGPERGPMRVLRGGSFRSGWGYMRFAARGSDLPSSTRNDFGFRVCLNGVD